MTLLTPTQQEIYELRKAEKTLKKYGLNVKEVENSIKEKADVDKNK